MVRSSTLRVEAALGHSTTAGLGAAVKHEWSNAFIYIHGDGVATTDWAGIDVLPRREISHGLISVSGGGADGERASTTGSLRCAPASMSSIASLIV